MKSSRLPIARIAPTRAFIAVVLCTMILQTGRGAAQQLDESCTVTVNGQTVQVNHDGSFVVPNIAAPDLFGAGGPGTAPDFLSDDFLRVIGTCMSGPQPLYVYGECFRIRRGESSLVGNLTFSSIPPQSLAALAAAPGIPTLTAIGQQTLINLTGSFSDGTSGPLNPQVHCPATFRTSNPAIVSVVPDAANPLRGVATARSAGTALITASVEGATSVTAITVAPGDPLTTVTGIVQTIDGDPVDGATVRFVVNGALIAGTGTTGGAGQAPGQFIVPGLASQLGPISAYATATISGTPRSGVSLLKSPVPAGFTDTGLITLDNHVFWITNANGPWSTTTNWVSGALPTTDQIAVINVPTDITVTLQQCPSCTTIIAGIECAETFAFANGGLTLNGPSFFQGAYNAGSGSSGAFLGGAGTVTFNGPVTLNGASIGNQNPGGAITFNAGLTQIGAFACQLFGRTFNNANNGVIAITGTGTLSRGFGSIFNNPSGSLFDFRSDGDSPDTAILTPPSALNNGGVFRKSGGTGLSTVGGVFDNTGAVEVQTGTLQLPGGTSPGSFTVSPGAALEFATTVQIPQNISGSVIVPATGALRFTGFGSTTNFTGPTQVSGQIFSNNGNANFNATASAGLAPSSISITAPGAAASALRFVGPISTGSVSIDTQGILAVAGTLTVNGPFNWTSGDHGDVNNPGTTILNGGMNLSGTGSRQLIARALTNSNNGSIIWTGGPISVTAGSTINNSSGSTFDIQTESDLNGGTGVNALNNAGTFRKSAGTASSTIVSLNVQNTGLIEAVVGTLEFPTSGAFVQTSGSTVLSGGSITRSGVGSAMQINGGTLGLGAGTSSGSISGSVTCGGIVTPGPGGAGKLTISGTYTQNAGGTLDIELGGTSPATEYDQLAVGGTSALGGTLKLTLINGFTPTVGQQFTILTAGTVSGTFANTVLANFPAGLAASASYSGTAVTVTITSQ